jgi:hypothetical protein
MHAFLCFAVHADNVAGMTGGIGHGFPSFGGKALAAGIIITYCVLSSYHDIALAAALILIISAGIRFTF